MPKIISFRKDSYCLHFTYRPFGQTSALKTRARPEVLSSHIAARGPHCILVSKLCISPRSTCSSFNRCRISNYFAHISVHSNDVQLQCLSPFRGFRIACGLLQLLLFLSHPLFSFVICLAQLTNMTFQTFVFATCQFPF